MPRPRTGQIVERKVTRKQKGKKAKTVTLVYARISYTDSSGKVKERWRRAPNRSDAKDVIKQLHQELDIHGPEALEHTRSTFGDLAAVYREKMLVAPTYVGNEKTSGQRSWRNSRSCLKALESYFGPKRLRSITRQALFDYRTFRAGVKTSRNKTRGMTSINRELQLLRAMLNWAKGEKWITSNSTKSADFSRPAKSRPR
jgi:hypothetical protein